MDVRAYYGIAGEIVKTIEPHTEADPAALLIQIIVAFGVLVGRLSLRTRHYYSTSKQRRANSERP